MENATYRYKLDWPNAQKRWDAFWTLEATDRPCLSVLAPRPDGRKIQLPELTCMEDKWLSPEYQLAKVLTHLEENHLGGEAVPHAIHLMAGTTTGCGDRIYFHEGGISIRPSMATLDEPLNWHPGPDDSWRPKVDAIYTLLLDHAPGRFIVTPPGQFTHLDLLNMLRGNAETMLDLAMSPAQVKARLHEMRELSFENEAHFRRLVDARQGNAGYLSWTGIWRRTPFYCAQADAAACISPEMFEEFVLPELDAQGERYGHLHYHTCGYQQHLSLCLSRPYMRVIQYSPNLKEPENGPAHLAFYRRVQKAGRCLDLSVGAGQLEFVIRHLRPEGLHISTTAKSVTEAEEILEHAVKWCGSDLHRS